MSDDATDGQQHSLLTPLFREYLKNEPEEGDNQTTLRTRMRNRVSVGLGDLYLFSQNARNDDIKQVFKRGRLAENTEANQPELDDRGFHDRTNFVHAMHMVALAWKGMRLNGADKEEVYQDVIHLGVAWGEADTQDVDLENVELDMPLRTLETYDSTSGFDPIEKYKRGLGLSGEDWQELTQRLDEKVDRNIMGEDLNPLIEKHLIEESDK